MKTKKKYPKVGDHVLVPFGGRGQLIEGKVVHVYDYVDPPRFEVEFWPMYADEPLANSYEADRVHPLPAAAA